MGQYVRSLFAPTKEGKISPSTLRIILAQGLVFLTGIVTIAAIIFTQETMIYSKFSGFYFVFYFVLLSFLQSLIMQRSIYCLACWLIMGILGAAAVYLVLWGSDLLIIKSIDTFLISSLGFAPAYLVEVAFIVFFAGIVFASLQSIWLLGKKILWIFISATFLACSLLLLIWFILIVEQST